jgi:glycosyltransferase involved in cell wall biosynthesis
MSKLVSVALATFNGEKYLRKQLDSIYSQTYKNIEVIVTDDCSVDQTINILKEYKNTYGLIYFINEQNLGFVKNFEKAISLCSGDYIALSDQDDIWLPEKIEILIREIKSYSLICTDAKLIDSTDNVVVSSFNEFSGRVQPKVNKFEYLVFGNFVTGCTAMMERELISRALPIPDEFLFHDYWLGIMATQENGIRYLSDKLVLYRQHDKNVSGAGIKISLLSFFSSVITKQKIIKNEYSLKNKRINFLLSKHIYSNMKEKQFLEDALDFTNLFIGKKSRIKSVFFALKNSKKIPQINSFWIRYIKVIYLFNKFLLAHIKSYYKKNE